jgi:hypothetical protein
LVKSGRICECAALQNAGPSASPRIKKMSVGYEIGEEKNENKKWTE